VAFLDRLPDLGVTAKSLLMLKDNVARKSLRPSENSSGLRGNLQSTSPECRTSRPQVLVKCSSSAEPELCPVRSACFAARPRGRADCSQCLVPRRRWRGQRSWYRKITPGSDALREGRRPHTCRLQNTPKKRSALRYEAQGVRRTVLPRDTAHAQNR